MYIIYDTNNVVKLITNTPTDQQKIDGVQINTDIPQAEYKFGKQPILKIDTTNNTLYYDYVDRPLTIEEQLKTPDDKYKELNLDTETLDNVKAAKIAQIKYLGENTIYAGFNSASTGHTFGLDLKDQSNFEQQRSDFIDDTTTTTVDWGTKDAGTITLTKDQFFTVRKEGKQFKWDNINRIRSFAAQVSAIVLSNYPTEADANKAVDAIVW